MLYGYILIKVIIKTHTKRSARNELAKRGILKVTASRWPTQIGRDTRYEIPHVDSQKIENTSPP